MDIPRFIDLVDDVDKAGDRLTNIAQTIIAALQWAGVEPKAAPGDRYDADEVAAEET